MNLKWDCCSHCTCGLVNLYSEIHQECLNESTSWQKKKKTTKNWQALLWIGSLGNLSFLLPPQMNWHLREEKEPRAPAKDRDCGEKGRGGVTFMTTGGLPGLLTGAAHWAHPASVVSRAPVRGALHRRDLADYASTVFRKWRINNQFNQFAIHTRLIPPLINHPGHSCYVYALISRLHVQHNGSLGNSFSLIVSHLFKVYEGVKMGATWHKEALRSGLFPDFLESLLLD